MINHNPFLGRYPTIHKCIPQKSIKILYRISWFINVHHLHSFSHKNHPKMAHSAGSTPSTPDIPPGIGVEWASRKRTRVRKPFCPQLTVHSPQFFQFCQPPEGWARRQWVKKTGTAMMVQWFEVHVHGDDRAKIGAAVCIWLSIFGFKHPKYQGSSDLRLRHFGGSPPLW